MNRKRSVNGWAISYGLRRSYADQSQFDDLLLFPIVRTTESVNCPPTPRLPFASDVKAPEGNGFYWTYDKCVFEDSVMRYFIRNRAGMPLDTAADEDEANDKVYRLNHDKPRDAGVQRFATGRKYKVVTHG
jgi:hypothetical protein